MSTDYTLIDNFCTSRDPSWLEKLHYDTKQFFLTMSKFVLDKQKGNQDIAQLVVDNLIVEGNVTISRLGGRGKPWPQAPDDYINVNVTSGSANKAGGYFMKQVSPMYLGPITRDIWPMIGQMKALLFENYWQYSKVFPDMKKPQIDTHGNVTPEWYRWRREGFSETKGHRHPRGTKTNEVMYVDDRGHNHYKYLRAIFALFGDESTDYERMDYITSRKKVYVPLYYELVVRTPAFQALREDVKRGKKVQILDLDAPDTTQYITPDFLKWAVNEHSPFGKPFGHGYVVAGALLGITPRDYT